MCNNTMQRLKKFVSSTIKVINSFIETVGFQQYLQMANTCIVAPYGHAEQCYPMMEAMGKRVIVSIEQFKIVVMYTAKPLFHQSLRCTVTTL